MTLSLEATTMARDATPSEVLYFKGLLGASVAGLLLPMDALAVAPGPLTGPQLMLEMAKAEPLISAVEQWQRAPWDLAPHPLSCDVSDPVTWCEAVVRAPALAPAGTRLRLPWSALCTAPPLWLQAPHVIWPPVEAEVCIDHLHGNELDCLPIGSLLWIAPSFGTDWPITVRDPLHRLAPRSGQWRRGQVSLEQLTLDPLCAAPTGTTRVPCTAPLDASEQADVVLAAPWSVPLEHWLGWSPTAARSAALPLNAQNLAVQVHQTGVVRASGGLLPLGRGHAFKVEAAASHPFEPSGETR